MALNVDPDLDHYRGIIPCGIAPGISGHGVTSLAKLGITVAMPEIDIALRATFAAVFGAPAACATPPLSCTAGEGGEHREPGEGAAAERPSPSHRSTMGPSLSRGAGEG